MNKSRLFIFLGAVFAGFIFFGPDLHDEQNGIRVTFHGAAGQVSGSMNEVNFEGETYLVDCGLYYPELSFGGASLEERQRRADRANRQMPLDASSVDAVFITHAHLDHCGRIPLLYKRGFRGEIYTTPGTARFLPVMLTMAVRYTSQVRNWVYSKRSIRSRDGKKYVTVHWNHCKWQDRISPRNRKTFKGSYRELEKASPDGIDEFSPCKSCAKKEVEAIMRLVKAVNPGEDVVINDKLKVWFIPTGHIPGAASVYMQFKKGQEVKRILFSGDVGNDMEILYPKPRAFPPADIIVLESTYGKRSHSLAEMKREESGFLDEINRQIMKGQKIIIPAFAMDRTQKMLYELKRYEIRTGYSPQIFCPSPSADKISRIYREELKSNRYGWFKPSLYKKYAYSNLFNNYIRRYPEPLRSSQIIVTTSGMMDNAYSSALLDELEDSSTTVFIVGYQDPQTPGGYLSSGVKAFDWKGKTYRVRAQVKKYHVFSGHTDVQFSLKLMEKQKKEMVSLILNHGEKEVLNANKKFFEQNGFAHVKIARPGQSVYLKLKKQALPEPALN